MISLNFDSTMSDTVARYDSGDKPEGGVLVFEPQEQLPEPVPFAQVKTSQQDVTAVRW